MFSFLSVMFIVYVHYARLNYLLSLEVLFISVSRYFPIFIVLHSGVYFFTEVRTSNVDSDSRTLTGNGCAWRGGERMGDMQPFHRLSDFSPGLGRFPAPIYCLLILHPSWQLSVSEFLTYGKGLCQESWNICPLLYGEILAPHILLFYPASSFLSLNSGLFLDFPGKSTKRVLFLLFM